MRTFDVKFGAGFLANVPEAPGIYRFVDAAGAVIYVGKAKNLRRRLAAYRGAGRRKVQKRMRRIVQQAATLETQTTASHLAACLLEIKVIQELRPKLNISGAYCFLYPYIGIAQSGDVLQLAISTSRDVLDNMMVHGAYRSRPLCLEAFHALSRLLAAVYHPERLPQRRVRALPRGTYVAAFRRCPPGEFAAWQAFLTGESVAVLPQLTLALLERPGARARAKDIQEDLETLQTFWHEEAQTLRWAMATAAYQGPYPVPQAARDPLFITARERSA